MKQVMSNYEKQVDIGKSYFLKYDQQLLAEKFHLETDEPVSVPDLYRYALPHCAEHRDHL